MSTSDGLPTGSERGREPTQAWRLIDPEASPAHRWLYDQLRRVGWHIPACFPAALAGSGEREPERDSVIVLLQQGKPSDTSWAFADSVVADGFAKAHDIQVRHVMETIRSVSFDFPWACRYEVAQWLLGRALVRRLETNHRIVANGLAASPPEAEKRHESVQKALNVAMVALHKIAYGRSRYTGSRTAMAALQQITEVTTGAPPEPDCGAWDAHAPCDLPPGHAGLHHRPVVEP